MNFADIVAFLSADIDHMGKEKFEKVVLEPALLQQFSFKNSYMNYIIKNSNHIVLQKLFQCCKYFYFKRPFVIADKLCLTNGQGLFDREEKIISTFPRRKYASQLKNLWLSGSLEIDVGDNGWNDEHVFKNISRNDIKVLSIKARTIQLKNLQMICNSSNLTDIKMNVTVLDDEKGPAPFEDILALFPNVQSFNLCHCYCTNETPQKLWAMEFKNKIQHFRFKYIKNEINPKILSMFFAKNLTHNGRAAIKFDRAIPFQRRQELTRTLQVYMYAWNKKYPQKMYFLNFF